MARAAGVSPARRGAAPWWVCGACARGAPRRRAPGSRAGRTTRLPRLRRRGRRARGGVLARGARSSAARAGAAPAAPRGALGRRDALRAGDREPGRGFAASSRASRSGRTARSIEQAATRSPRQPPDCSAAPARRRLPAGAPRRGRRRGRRARRPRPAPRPTRAPVPRRPRRRADRHHRPALPRRRPARAAARRRAPGARPRPDGAPTPRPTLAPTPAPVADEARETSAPARAERARPRRPRRAATTAAAARNGRASAAARPRARRLRRRAATVRRRPSRRVSPRSARRSACARTSRPRTTTIRRSGPMSCRDDAEAVACGGAGRRPGHRGARNARWPANALGAPPQGRVLVPLRWGNAGWMDAEGLLGTPARSGPTVRSPRASDSSRPARPSRALDLAARRPLVAAAPARRAVAVDELLPVDAFHVAAEVDLEPSLTNLTARGEEGRRGESARRASGLSRRAPAIRAATHCGGSGLCGSPTRSFRSLGSWCVAFREAFCGGRRSLRPGASRSPSRRARAAARRGHVVEASLIAIGAVASVVPVNARNGTAGGPVSRVCACSITAAPARGGGRARALRPEQRRLAAMLWPASPAPRAKPARPKSRRRPRRFRAWSITAAAARSTCAGTRRQGTRAPPGASPSEAVQQAVVHARLDGEPAARAVAARRRWCPPPRARPAGSTSTVDSLSHRPGRRRSRARSGAGRRGGTRQSGRERMTKQCAQHFVASSIDNGPIVLRLTKVARRQSFLSMNFLSQIERGETVRDARAPPAHQAEVPGGRRRASWRQSAAAAPAPVQSDLRWGCDRAVADRICCFHRHYAEHSGSAARGDGAESRARALSHRPARARASLAATSKDALLADVARPRGDLPDSVSGRPLFTAPRGQARPRRSGRSRRTAGRASAAPGELGFRRCLPDGECVSVDGTHLGHNLPDRSGNRCAPPPRSRRASGRARWRALSLRRARARTQTASTSSPSPGTRPRRARPRPARVPRDLAPSRGSPIIWRRH